MAAGAHTGTPLQAFPVQQLKAELEAKAVVFARARMGQPCLEACSDLGCARRECARAPLAFFLVEAFHLAKCSLIF